MGRQELPLDLGRSMCYYDTLPRYHFSSLLSNLYRMQTFLTHDMFRETASILDRQRLGKQRLEAWQIIKINNKHADNQSLILPSPVGYEHHPAVKMWRGYSNLLCLYGMRMCMEWKTRRYQDNLHDLFLQESHKHEFIIPPWWTDPEEKTLIISSHRGLLVVKDPVYYNKIFPDAKPVAKAYYPRNTWNHSHRQMHLALGGSV